MKAKFPMHKQKLNSASYEILKTGMDILTCEFWPGER